MDILIIRVNDPKNKRKNDIQRYIKGKKDTEYVIEEITFEFEPGHNKSTVIGETLDRPYKTKKHYDYIFIFSDEVFCLTNSKSKIYCFPAQGQWTGHLYLSEGSKDNTIYADEGRFELKCEKDWIMVPGHISSDNANFFYGRPPPPYKHLNYLFNEDNQLISFSKHAKNHTVYGEGGNDFFLFSENSQKNTGDGGDDDDILISTSHDHFSRGGAGDDIIMSFMINKDSKNDVHSMHNGGPGHDFIVHSMDTTAVTSDSVVYIRGGAGNDTIIPHLPVHLVQKAGTSDDNNQFDYFFVPPARPHGYRLSTPERAVLDFEENMQKHYFSKKIHNKNVINPEAEPKNADYIIKPGPGKDKIYLSATSSPLKRRTTLAGASLLDDTFYFDSKDMEQAFRDHVNQAILEQQNDVAFDYNGHHFSFVFNHRDISQKGRKNLSLKTKLYTEADLVKQLRAKFNLVGSFSYY